MKLYIRQLTRSTDKLGLCLRVPASIVRKLGLKPGQEVAVASLDLGDYMITGFLVLCFKLPVDVEAAAERVVNELEAKLSGEVAER